MKHSSNKILMKISAFIVKFRYVFFGIFLVCTVLSIFGIGLVKVNNSMASYLPPESETRQALDIMSKEFETADSTEIMIKDISLEDTHKIVQDIIAMDSVSSVTFDESTNYIDGKALITVTLHATDDKGAQKAINDVRDYLDDYHIALRGSTARSLMFSEMMQSEMLVILLIAIAVIIVVLLLTSKSFFEIPIFIVTFVVAAILNMGTNFMLGSISFITNSIAIILQLALAIDYAIVFSHRYAEEVEKHDNAKDAIIAALASSIPSILASSLTTISGLIAVMFMQFRIGFDIGIVLTKGIFFSFITVFLLMPGLLYVSSNLMKKTRHKSYVPSVERPMKFVQKGRKIIPIVGLALIVAGCIGQMFTTYTYDNSLYPIERDTAYSKGIKEIDDTFGEATQVMGIIVDAGNYEAEYVVSNHILEKYINVDEAIIENVVSIGGITGGMDPYAEFSYIEANELIMNIANYAYNSGMIEVDPSTMNFESALKQVYFVYNLEINGSLITTNLKLPLFTTEDKIGVLPYVLNTVNPLITNRLDAETKALIKTLNSTVPTIKELLQGSEHSRIILTIKSGINSENKQLHKFIDEIRHSVKELNLYEDTFVFGDSVSFYDIEQSFTNDKTLVNILTIIFILVILFISFRSLSLPVMLVLVIQGAIWINFSIYALFNIPMLFMSYLIVSAINMGATIDYAIVVTNRYRELRDQGIDKITAGCKAVSNSFNAIMTSSSIMIIAGFIIGAISTEPYIFTIGFVLGSGTIISLLLVIFLLPSLLMVGDGLIQKTTLGGHKWKKQEEALKLEAEEKSESEEIKS